MVPHAHTAPHSESQEGVSIQGGVRNGCRSGVQVGVCGLHVSLAAPRFAGPTRWRQSGLLAMLVCVSSGFVVEQRTL